MESKKINQLATELAPDLSDLTIIGDPTTGISKKITLSQMASLFTGTVEEYANLAAFPLVGVADTIYVAKDTNVIYRWDSTAYVVLSPNIIASLVFNDANGFDGTIALVGSVATLTITTALTTGSVSFIGASGALLEDNTNFFWNNTNKRLGIGTNTPGTKLDVHGTGTIVQINGTTTNNAFISFQNAGVSKWTIGNVQADHRFRIYSEANSAELVSVLQTGEFGIGIANPLTKLHIFGGASALIANLDANVSVAKSISFRSGNSSRINLEVSGTESGTNAGANFYLRAYTDAGALLSTPLTIARSTGEATFANNVYALGFFFNSTIPQGSIFFAGASNQITQNQPKFYWDNTNNRLGIGTNTPQRSLHIINASDTRLMISDSAVSSTTGLYIRQYGSKASIVNQSNDIFQLATNDTYFMTATTAGNIGFNTDTPNRAGLTSGITVVTIAPASTTTERWGALELCGNRTSGENQVGSLYFTNINTTNTAIALIQAINGASSVSQGSLLFYTNSGTLTEKMRILSTGQIGIGTQTVDSTISVDIQNASPTSNNVFLRIKNNAGSEDCGIKISGTFGTAYEHTFGVNTLISSGDLVFHNSNTLGYRWYVDGNNKLQLTSDGNLTASGTTKSSSFNTATGSASIITQSSGWSTFYTVSNYQNAIYLVTLQLNGYAGYTAYATICQNDSSLIIMNQYNSTAQIQISGLNIQGTQNSGSTQSMQYRIIKIA